MSELCIGVTGHRRLVEPRMLEQRVGLFLRRLDRRFTGAGLPPPALTVASPLAEGADRLVARVVLRRPGARLLALLPLPPDEYRTDFSAASALEFDALLDRAEWLLIVPPALSREAAYAAAGLAVLARCDLLIALWDGMPARGPGGTGDLVAEARSRSLPLVWIHTHPPFALHEERTDRLVPRSPETQRKPASMT